MIPSRPRRRMSVRVGRAIIGAVYPVGLPQYANASALLGRTIPRTMLTLETIRQAPKALLHDHLDGGLRPAIGSAKAAAAGRPIVMKMLVTAMRQAARSVEVADCAIRWRDAGVVGFDIAGPEAGYRPTRHLDAFDRIRHGNFHITIHAGEGFGLPSIWEALQFCGAERLGHGVRIVDDIAVLDDGSVELGRLAAFVRDRRVPLEMCPTSNVHSGAAA